MKLLYGLAGIAILVSAVSPLSANAQGSSGILISEINWAGSEKSQADEWIELVNVTDTRKDISGWLLVGAATGGDAIALPDATILEAGEILLIANYKNGDEKSTLGINPNLVTTSLSLANSSLHVFLTDPHGLVHDSYEDTGTPDFGSSSPITSIERDVVTNTWKNSMSSIGLIVTTQFGTPGTFIFAEENVASTSVQIEETITAVVLNTESETISETSTQPDNPQEITTQKTGQETVSVANTNEEVTENPEEIADQNAQEPVALATPLNTVSIQESPNVTEVNLDTELIAEMVTNESATIEKLTSGSAVVLERRYAKINDVLFNEVLSAPTTGDEWVEIYNTTSETFSLDSWTLTDKSGKTTTLSGDIESYGYYLIKNPAGKLNNDGDDLFLKNEYGDLIDKFTYGTEELPAPEKDQSLAYTKNGWLTGEPTPEKTNPEPVIKQAIEEQASSVEPIYAQEINTHSTQMDPDTSSSRLEEQNTATSADATDGVRRVIAIAQPLVENVEKTKQTNSDSNESTAKKAKAIARITTSEVVSLNHGDKASVTGLVIMEPMKVAKQVMYLEGLEVYFHDASWPKIPVGSTVTLTGSIDHESINTRIKLASVDDIVIHEDAQDPMSTTVSVADLASIGSGRLVTITGELTLLTKAGFTLKTDGGDIAVNLKAASNITTSKLTTGTTLVTGVLIKNKAGAFEVYPRSSEDLKQDTATKTVPSETTLGAIAPTDNGFPTTTAGLSLGAIAVGLASYWLLKTKPELLTSLTSHLETYVR